MRISTGSFRARPATTIAGLAAVVLGLAAAPGAAQPMSDRSQREEAPDTTGAAEPASRASSSRQAEARDEPGPFSVRTGLGFAIDPDSFLLGFEGDYAFTNQVSAGVLVELGLDDDLVFVSPVAYGRYRFDLGELTDEESVRKLFPFVQGGLGFTHWDVDRRGDDDDTEFLLNLGFGVEYEVAEDVSVVSQMLFNIVPDKVFDERFYYSWEVMSVRYRF